MNENLKEIRDRQFYFDGERIQSITNREIDIAVNQIQIDTINWVIGEIDERCTMFYAKHNGFSDIDFISKDRLLDILDSIKKG